MAARYPALANGLKARLDTLLADDSTLVIERRLKPRYDRVEFEDAKRYLSLYCGAYSESIIGRQVDREEWDVLLAIQAAGPNPTATAGANPFANVTSAGSDPVTWGDTVFDLVERVKGFWRAETDEAAEGDLRSRILAGCIFQQLEHNPVYIPSHLEELGIMSTVLRITYRVTDFTEQD